jgi:predicted DNA-binding transcriptional regulator AlpA
MSIEDDDEALVREPERLQITKTPRPSWYRLMSEGRAPRPVRLSPRVVAWRLGELKAWRRDPENYRAAP